MRATFNEKQSIKETMMASAITATRDEFSARNLPHNSVLGVLYIVSTLCGKMLWKVLKQYVVIRV